MSSREPDATDNFNVVAGLLIDAFEHLDEEEFDALWERAGNSRVRSAVSRAYYSVFLALKYRLSRFRAEWPRNFPRNAVHAKVQRALSGALGVSHALTGNFKQMERARSFADYDWTHPSRLGEARSAIQVARESLTYIDQLTDDELRKLAGELAHIDRTWGSKT